MRHHDAVFRWYTWGILCYMAAIACTGVAVVLQSYWPFAGALVFFAGQLACSVMAVVTDCRGRW